ncbi:MAG: hypothetical protein JRJ12_04285 [Deltaproteobacteria bacterium]|nr:hypothetical protein [Deltaproteobacteria bacterium]MBW2070514.1 hypothetical protein [Deltaproteobacteria bacterium]
MAAELFTSEALRINLQKTRVRVDIEPRYQILAEVVRQYAGIEQQTRKMLLELSHPYRNWAYVVQEARRYGLKNFGIYLSHARGATVFSLLADIFLEAINSCRDRQTQVQAADNLIVLVERLAADGTGRVQQYGGVLQQVLANMAALPADSFFLVASSYYSLKKIGRHLLEDWRGVMDLDSYCRLVSRALGTAYEYWLEQEDPQKWFADQADQWWDQQEHGPPLAPVSHQRLQILRRQLQEIESSGTAVARTERLLELPDYMDIVRYYERLPSLLGSDRPFPKVLILYKIIENRGLEVIHEDSLRQINYSLAQIIQQQPLQVLSAFLERTFSVLQTSKKLHPERALTCIATIGKEVFKTGNRRLIDQFLGLTISAGFEFPGSYAVSVDWQLLTNPVHIHNIRVWLEIIAHDPRQAPRLLSALLVNLALGGVCIRDTDIFQRDVSKLLNSRIEPVYNLVKQLARVFPVYFNEIGAEGRLREVSTEIDELCRRKDPLIHFLRKLSHVESSNTIVDFMNAIALYWLSKDPEAVRHFVPVEIYQQLQPQGPYIDEAHLVLRRLFEAHGLQQPRDLLKLDLERLATHLERIAGASAREKKRVALFVEFYHLLAQKYQSGIQDVVSELQRAQQLGMPAAAELIQRLNSAESSQQLLALLDYLEKLKEIILSEKQTSGFANIYRKRHIAVDIPSLYGTYHERKFDALGLSFRLENVANTLFTERMAAMNLRFVTRATFFQISKFIKLLIRALELEGINCRPLKKQLALLDKALEIRRFSYSQYLDIFRGFSLAIKQIIATYYQHPHQDNLNLVLQSLTANQLVPRYRLGSDSESQGDFIHKVSEALLRDLVARTFGLQCFDNLISRVINTLNKQRVSLDTQRLDLLMSYDPEKALCSIVKPNKLTYDLIHLGSKGYNLVVLAEYGIPVPEGFIVTTEIYRCFEVLQAFPPAFQDFLQRVAEHISSLEAATGCCFGRAARPLLLSVRSGAAVSMPGMMNTFLNVGINEEIVEGLIQETGEWWFAWDSYRRFLQSWGMAFGMDRDEFDTIMNDYKQRYGRELKRQFSRREIREVARAYRGALQHRGVALTDDPHEQLRTAIVQVMKSWQSPKARTYREIMGISDNWGTAVTVQAMVYGNLDTNSGAGVAFTHNPRKMDDRLHLWGDFTLGNQGEDVVAGLVKTLPLSEEQKVAEGRSEEICLESRFPEIYSRLQELAERLIAEHGWGPQEIEFTFQGGGGNGLFVLQSRDMHRPTSRRYCIFSKAARLEEAYLSSGIGVSGGALSGRAVFNLGEIERYRQEAPGEPLILVRADTVPDDIKEISAADGILSARGGATSHAAIVAYRLGKTCVVGCDQLRVWENESRCLLRQHEIRAGDPLSIDGRSGAIYLGRQPTETVELWQ